MDRKINILYFILVIGAIIFAASIANLPTTGGQVPLGMDIDEYHKQQTNLILESTAFKVAMGGLSLCIASMLYILIVSVYNDIRSILPRNIVKPLPVSSIKPIVSVVEPMTSIADPVSSAPVASDPVVSVAHPLNDSLETLVMEKPKQLKSILKAHHLDPW